jgi:hypothetical protein
MMWLPSCFFKVHKPAWCIGHWFQPLTFTAYLAILLLLPLLTGCGPDPTLPTPTLPPAPTATATPLPTPTPTPIPPIPLTIHWPHTVSALEGVSPVVELPGLVTRDPDARVSARVTDPRHRIVWESELECSGDGMCSPLSPLHLPLYSEEGRWRLAILVRTQAEISGRRTMTFRPDPIPLQDLSGQVRSTIRLPIPQSFTVVQQMGDEVAGGRVWTGAGGEVGVWWLPGPAEDLTPDTAQMVVEATLPARENVQIESLEAGENWGLPAVYFAEQWADGAARSVVVQGPDRWLYLLRVRGLDGEPVPPLFEEIWNGFWVAEE